MSNKNLTIGVVVAIVIAIVGCFFPRISAAIQAGATNYTDLSANTLAIGSGCGDAYKTCVSTILGSSVGLVQSGNLATTTPASMTMTATDLTSGYATISVNPTVASVTITLPASSTLATFLPNVGDTKTFTLFNSTSTANTVVTLAAGTGTLVEAASSTATTVAPKTVAPLKAATLTVFRSSDTDLIFLMNPYI